MIFKEALRRELSFTTGGVFLVLVTIMVTTLVIRILGYAAYFHRYFYLMTGRIILGPLITCLIFIMILLSNTVCYLPL